MEESVAMVAAAPVAAALRFPQPPNNRTNEARIKQGSVSLNCALGDAALCDAALCDAALAMIAVKCAPSREEDTTR
jgi:hypothetical protein